VEGKVYEDNVYQLSGYYYIDQSLDHQYIPNGPAYAQINYFDNEYLGMCDVLNGTGLFACDQCYAMYPNETWKCQPISIGRVGCALVSLAIIADWNAQKVYKPPLGVLELHDLIKNARAYDIVFGTIDIKKACAVISKYLNATFEYHPDHCTDADIDDAICEWGPTGLGVYQQLSGQSGHRVVAIGKPNNGAFEIVDAYDGLFRSLAAPWLNNWYDGDDTWVIEGPGSQYTIAGKSKKSHFIRVVNFFPRFRHGKRNIKSQIRPT
jgi:hypothetical protein